MIYSGVWWLYSGVFAIQRVQDDHIFKRAFDQGPQSYVLRHAKSETFCIRAHMKPKACAKHSYRDRRTLNASQYGHDRKHRSMVIIWLRGHGVRTR